MQFKLVSWNVNGLRACMQKGFAEFFTASDADIFCIQESKLQEGQIDFAPEGYYAYWNYAQKKKLSLYTFRQAELYMAIVNLAKNSKNLITCHRFPIMA